MQYVVDYFPASSSTGFFPSLEQFFLTFVLKVSVYKTSSLTS